MAFKVLVDDYYQSRVIFIYKENKESVDKYMLQHYQLPINDSVWMLGKSACVSSLDNKETGDRVNILCYQVDELHSGLMAHEIFHLACNILERAGMKFGDDSEEAYAYCIQYWMKRFVNWTYEVLEKEKKKKKNGRSSNKSNNRSKARPKSRVRSEESQVPDNSSNTISETKN